MTDDRKRAEELWYDPRIRWRDSAIEAIADAFDAVRREAYQQGIEDAAQTAELHVVSERALIDNELWVSVVVAQAIRKLADAGDGEGK